MKGKHYLLEERGEYWLCLTSVVAAASHFVCGRSQSRRRRRFRGRVGAEREIVAVLLEEDAGRVLLGH